MSRIAFKIPSVYSDLGEGDGVLHLENDQILIEYQIKDAFIGVLKSNIQKVIVPLVDIHDIVFQSKLIHSKLILSTKKMSTLANIPGSEKGEIKLNIARSDKANAQQFVEDVMFRVSELRLKQMDT
ncbi:MAG: hypothetical protein H6629_18690 [Calditrichae bacterium]|nr:hypothetical protein [Calditrichia bacterium]